MKKLLTITITLALAILLWSPWLTRDRTFEMLDESDYITTSLLNPDEELSNCFFKECVNGWYVTWAPFGRKFVLNYPKNDYLVLYVSFWGWVDILND